MKPFPTVSVIIPTYGHAEYIVETLESVFLQSFQDFEVIVVNDGSPDQTGEILQPYIDSGVICYIEQANAGVAVARNVGIARSKGKYIALLDDDDLWPLDKLEWQVTEIERTNGIAIGGTAGFFDECAECQNEPEVMEPDREIHFHEYFSGNPFWSPGQTLIGRDAIIEVGGFDEKIWGADDFDLYVRLSKLGKFVKSSRRSLYYRKHQSNASRDCIRMITNTNKVLLKHFKNLHGRERSQCRRRGYRWMFQYFGIEVLQKVGEQLRDNTVPWRDSVSKVILLLRIFGFQMLIDPKFLRRVLGSLLELLPIFAATRLFLGGKM